MNVRLFLLVAMTALFVAVWSSDQQYQETQMAAARSARQRTVERETASVNRCIVPRNRAPLLPTSPFAASFWVAPTFAAPEIAMPIREPVIAPRVMRTVPAPTLRAFGQRYRFMGKRLSNDVGSAEAARPTRSLETHLAEFVRWAGRVRFEIDGETCWMRWQMRRTAYFAQRRTLAFVSRQWDWRDLVQKLARETFRPLDRAAKSAALPGIDEKR